MRRPLHRSERSLALLTGDAVALTAAVLLALWTWSLTAGFPLSGSFLRARLLWFASVPLWLLVLIPTRRAGTALDLLETAKGIGRAACVLLLVYLTAFFSVGGARLPRLIALYILWDGTLLLLGWRLIAQWSLTHAAFGRRIVVIGSGRPIDVARQVLARPEFRDAQIKIIPRPQSPDAAGLRELPVDGDATDLVLAFDADVADSWMPRLLAIQERGTNVVRMTQLYEETLRRVPVAHLESSWLLTSFFDVAKFRDASPIVKRAFDLGVGLALAAVGIVLTPFIALAIALESGGPVFYRQRRLGRGGREFWLTKFRSMRPDAEKDGAPRWSPPNDPRVTRVGRLLRRTRLDELPNVLAILRGDLSVVGPRPERQEFAAQLEQQVPFYRARLIVRPGLTGWAQVNLPYGDSVGDASAKLEFDLYYVKHQSIWFDAFIVLRTLGTLVRFAGR